MMEDEVRESLRNAMAAVSKPPPMSSATVLSTARRARRRKRAAWLCGGSAAVIAAVLGGAVLAGGGSAGAGMPWVAGAPPVAGADTSTDTSTDTQEPWPTGPDGEPQQDRTARAGARYEQGVRLLGELLAALPAGYTAPDASADNQSPPYRYHQASFDERVNGAEVWSYQAYTALTAAGRTGRVLVEVHTPGNSMAQEPCALAQQFWGMAGECQVVAVGTAQVGVVVNPAQDRRFDQWAAYRYPDGVVVFVAQSLAFYTNSQPLVALPFSAQELAALAANERFRPS